MMPLFHCSKCGAIENTALGAYWYQSAKGEPVLCSECSTGTWHGRFPKTFGKIDHRPLSLAEELGWRRFWDGWIICPPCLDAYMRLHEIAIWRVPPWYDTPIGEAHRDFDPHCMKCRRKAPLELTWKSQCTTGRIKPRLTTGTCP